MRIIIYGVGAVGGTLAVALADAGQDVVGIARGAQLEALQSGGLRLITPKGTIHRHFPSYGDPSNISPRPTDVILLTVKTQDTFEALQRLRAAGFHHQPVFCFQNGIANEDMVLRLFPEVFGVVVTLPATFVKPGEVADFFSPRLGIFDIGRHGAGDLAMACTLSQMLERAGFAAQVHDDLTPWRYGKLLVNLINAIDVVLGSKPQAEFFAQAARAEGEMVLRAAGIVANDTRLPERQALAKITDIAGFDRVGSSSSQSVARGAGSIETDFLNGEIVLMGRKLGIPTPVNAWFAMRAQIMVRDRETVGSVQLEEVYSALWMI